MIHIGTFHYREDRWVDLQLEYLARHTREPYRVYASLDGVDPRHASRFHRARDHTKLSVDANPGYRIEEKLNLITDEMVSEGEADDLLVIMHGDTIPITDWVGPVREMTAESRLAAVRRDEIGEPIPHWSFVATTVGFWSEIGAEWSRGPTWPENGKVTTDTGASLWKLMQARGVEWRPLLRSNRTNLHHVLFAVYGGLIYHHGAGFRQSITRWDSAGYLHLPIPLRNFAGVQRRIANTVRSERLYRRIRRDEGFYRELTGEAV